MNRCAVLALAVLCVAGARAGDLLSIPGAVPTDDPAVLRVCQEEGKGLSIRFDPMGQEVSPLREQGLHPDYLVVTQRFDDAGSCPAAPFGSGGYCSGDQIGPCSKAMQHHARSPHDKSLVTTPTPLWFYQMNPAPKLELNWRGNSMVSGWSVRGGVTCDGKDYYDESSHECVFKFPMREHLLLQEGGTYDVFLAAWYTRYSAYSSFNMLTFKYEPAKCHADKLEAEKAEAERAAAEHQKKIDEDQRREEEEKRKAAAAQEAATKEEEEKAARAAEADKKRQEEDLEIARRHAQAASEAAAAALRMQKEKEAKAAEAEAEARRASEERQKRIDAADGALESFKAAMLTGKISAEDVTRFVDEYVAFEAESLGERAAAWSEKWMAVKEAVSGDASSENHKAVIAHLRAEEAAGICSKNGEAPASGESATAPQEGSGDVNDDTNANAPAAERDVLDSCAALNKKENSCEWEERCLGEVPEALIRPPGKKNKNKKIPTCEEARAKGLLTAKDTNYCACMMKDGCVVNEYTKGSITIHVCEDRA